MWQLRHRQIYKNRTTPQKMCVLKRFPFRSNYETNDDVEQHMKLKESGQGKGCRGRRSGEGGGDEKPADFDYYPLMCVCVECALKI